jgi:cobyrinic acid a,c-diamide synthase
MGIMYKLNESGFTVQPYKIGPDFIDPCYHSFITGRQSRNLDVWLMGRKGILECFESNSCDADLSVVEGVMGLFDGIPGKRSLGSTAHVSKILDAPIILVVDAARTSQSIAAMILGYTRFDPSLKVAGFVINNVGSEKHSHMILDALDSKVKSKVIGIIYRNEQIRSVERHLGLIPPTELKSSGRKIIFNCARYVADHIKLDGILPSQKTRGEDRPRGRSIPKKERQARCKIAIALDESFNFYYYDNLSSLRRNGASLLFFSPLREKGLPDDIDGLFIGGGFPEVLAKRLETNDSMKKSIHKSIVNGIPTFAECGGLMYLTKTINDNRKKKQGKYTMVGVFDVETLMTNKITIGYTEALAEGEILGQIPHVRGHEFHYSEIENIPSDSQFSFSMKRGRGITGRHDGLTYNGCIASYMHLHFADTRVPRRILEKCLLYKRR